MIVIRRYYKYKNMKTKLDRVWQILEGVRYSFGELSNPPKGSYRKDHNIVALSEVAAELIDNLSDGTNAATYNHKLDIQQAYSIVKKL